jgi:hypothetical protein
MISGPVASDVVASWSMLQPSNFEMTLSRVYCEIGGVDIHGGAGTGRAVCGYWSRREPRLSQRKRQRCGPTRSLGVDWMSAGTLTGLLARIGVYGEAAQIAAGDGGKKLSKSTENDLEQVFGLLCGA